jgi:uncharacterized membrane protein YdjX (TVP38/TMEM64 family)
MKKDIVSLRIALGIAVVAGLIIAARLLPVSAWIAALQTWVRGTGPSGYVLYALIYAIAGLFFSGLVLTLGAGALFGTFAGTLVVLAGATSAATIAFLLARTVLRSRIERMVASRRDFAAVDRAVTREGAKIVFLIRLAAIFPFLFVNYAFGLTGIKTGSYVLATLIGIIPTTVAFVYLGSAGAALATQTTTARIITITGAVIALVVSIWIARVASAEIRRAGVEKTS